jgi:hypothetical protein
MKEWDEKSMDARTRKLMPRIRLHPAALLIVPLLLSVGGAPRAQASDLSKLLLELYTEDGRPGITLADTGHDAHFLATGLTELNSLSEDLASGLGLFAFNSTVSSYTFDFELGVPVRSTESLGPILSERATTLGRNRFTMGFSYFNVDFKRFEGQDLDDLTLFFTHQDVNGDGILGPTPANPSDIELDRVQVDVNLQLQEQFFTLYGTYGVTRNFDIGVAVPIVWVQLQADAHGSITGESAVGSGPPPLHLFDETFADSPNSSVRDSAVGIGDVLLRGKYNFLRTDSLIPNLAFVGQVKFPTGDEKDLLGTGDTRGMAMFVADQTFGRFSPHLNVGYEIVGGASSLNNLRYFVGVDARLNERFTGIFDLIGRWEPSGDGVGDNLIDAAVGGKLNFWRNMVLVTNFIVPLNRSQGLRPDFVWSVGLEYTFGGAE